ncbi:hypothetical protein NT6N_05670 [Oceaniferula spumae]|uniref:Peptidase M15A C-terminal domain-containing protein n=1 Tax=Oceaniferula spumae TaxID=2979115 RepID=A0AAT9FHR6_9BACT
MMNDLPHTINELRTINTEYPSELPAACGTSVKRRSFLKNSSLLMSGAVGASWLGLKNKTQFTNIWNQLVTQGERLGANIQQGVGEGLSPAMPPRKAPVIEQDRIYRPRPLPDLPQVKTYSNYLAQQNLPYLSPEEIIQPHFKYRSGVCSGVPPKRLWRNMLHTSKVANEIRERLGIRLETVASAYRSPEYNALCPGAAKYSQHTQNRALDLMYACPPKYAFDMACKLRDEGFFKGGVGLYNSFIHIDTRGRNATWGV